MTKLLGMILCLCLALGLTNSKAQSQAVQKSSASSSNTKRDECASRVDALMAQWTRVASRGAAVLVIQNGQVLLRKGFGLANAETKVPIEPDTVFDLASVSKQFTAMAILILVERGKLNLDDPFTKFLRENVFQPLGMKSNLVADESKPKIKNRATSYAVEEENYVDADSTPLNLIYGDGNVNTTIDDMYLWDQALYTEKLTKASTLRMLQERSSESKGE